MAALISRANLPWASVEGNIPGAGLLHQGIGYEPSEVESVTVPWIVSALHVETHSTTIAARIVSRKRCFREEI